MTMKTKKDEIVRAWFLIKVGDLADDKKGDLARRIYFGANSRDKVERNKGSSNFASNKKEYAKKDKVIVVRADLVDNIYDLVVPVNVEFPNELDKIEGRIRELALEMGITSEMIIIDRLKVIEHVPFPPQNTMGFITYEEVNSPPRGSQGHSPW